MAILKVSLIKRWEQGEWCEGAIPLAPFLKMETTEYTEDAQRSQRLRVLCASSVISVVESFYTAALTPQSLRPSDRFLAATIAGRCRTTAFDHIKVTNVRQGAFLRLPSW
jgi:hypothetical protein